MDDLIIFTFALKTGAEPEHAVNYELVLTQTSLVDELGFDIKICPHVGLMSRNYKSDGGTEITRATL